MRDTIQRSRRGAWNVLLDHIDNGTPDSPPRFDIKDDNLHTAFRMSEGWRYGDRYRFQATHFSPATNTTYVAAVNECLIVPRVR